MVKKYTFSIPAGATVVLPSEGGLAQTIDAVDQLRHAAGQANASAVAKLGGGSDWSVTVDDDRELEFKMVATEVIAAYATGSTTI